MKKSFIVLFVCMFSMLSACVVQPGRPTYENRRDAYYDYPQFQNRVENQQRRINQGVASGELTRKEADLLQDNLNRIRNKYEKMKADGILTSKEIERLEKLLDKNHEMIYRSKHNPVQRFNDVDFDFQERIENQERSINQGFQSRELTRREADILQDNLNWIRNRYARMKSDRRLTQEEIDEIDNMLDINNSMIYNRRHNPARRIY